MDNYTTKKKPDPPKKPLSAYFLFINEYRSSIMKENPGIKVHDVAKIAGEMWRNIEESKKEKYLIQQRELKTAYDKSIEEYELAYGKIKVNGKPRSSGTEASKKKKKK